LGSHLLGLRDCSREEIESILDRASYFDGYRNQKLTSLKGLSIAALFFEPSTRTRFSFEVATRWLSGEFYNFSTESSSVVKGESLLDSVNTLKSMGINAMIVRHRASGILQWLSTKISGISLINAGDGSHEHPTQALLDLYTIKKYHSSLEGLKVLMIGDIKHSRVVRSSVTGLKAMGARVTLAGPPTLLPKEFAREGVEISWDIHPYMNDADVVYMLRLQKERQKKGLIPSLKEYTRLYGLNEERLKYLKPGALVMHPGPMNIGVEITAEALKQLEDHNDIRLGINEQVESGVVVRAAVLDYLMGEKPR